MDNVTNAAPAAPAVDAAQPTTTDATPTVDANVAAGP